MREKERGILAFIGARSGSKGIINKNVIDFAGKPLLAWTIEAARRSKYIKRVIVSTDSEEIRRTAIHFGADAPFLRPAELAGDQSSLDDALRHCLAWIKENEKQSYDYVMRLQPSSPLRKTRHIDEAVEYYFKNRKTDKDTLVSVEMLGQKFGWIMQKNRSGYLEFSFGKKVVERQRQELASYYMPNGAIYLAPYGEAVEAGFYGDNTLPFEMRPEESIDLDTPEDLERALSCFRKLSLPGSL